VRVPNINPGRHDPERRPVVFPAFDGATAEQIEKRSPAESDNDLTTDTVSHMVKYAREDAQRRALQIAAQDVRTLSEGSSHRALAAGVHYFLRTRVRYDADSKLAAAIGAPLDSEILIRPADLLMMKDPRGDCDEFASSAAALLLALDVPVFIKTVKCNPLARHVWSHVYVVARMEDGTLLPLDCSHGPYPGWETSPIFHSKLWPVHPLMNTQVINVKSGLASADYGGEYGAPDTVTYGEQPAATASGAGFDWGSLINNTTKAASSILGARYGVAQLAPGQYQRNADGSIMYQGLPSTVLPTQGTTGAGSSLLLLGVAAVIAVIVLTSRKTA
jgi:hypothetical protein